MSGVVPCSAHFAAVEVELLLERDVRQERRHGDAPPVLGGELVRAVRGSAERDPELPAPGTG